MTPIKLSRGLTIGLFSLALSMGLLPRQARAETPPSTPGASNWFIPPHQESLIVSMLKPGAKGCVLDEVAIDKDRVRAEYVNGPRRVQVVLFHPSHQDGAIQIRTTQFGLLFNPASGASDPCVAGLPNQIKAIESGFKWGMEQGFSGPPPSVEGASDKPTPRATPAPDKTGSPAIPRRTGVLAKAKPERAHACSPHASVGGEWNCMVRLAPARFLMGAQSTRATSPPSGNHSQSGFDPDAQADESPPHEVSLKPFWIHVTEVDQMLVDRCIQDGACDPKDPKRSHIGTRPSRSRPQTEVTWQEARDLCAWIGGRLPTEAEWEYAARGPQGRRYPWGDEAPDCQRAIMFGEGGSGCNRGGPAETFYVRTTLTPPNNNFGFLHMAGNVWEWVADWYAPDYYKGSPANSPKGPATGTRRVMRGGGWLSRDAKELRSAGRASSEPGDRSDDLGFRCVADEVLQ